MFVTYMASLQVRPFFLIFLLLIIFIISSSTCNWVDELVIKMIGDEVDKLINRGMEEMLVIHKEIIVSSRW